MSNKETRLVPAQQHHVQRMADCMRPADAEEIRLSHGHTPFESLSHALSLSPESVLCETIGGDPICMYGVAPMAGQIGCPWLLGTPLMTKHSHFIARESLRHIKTMRKNVFRLENWVHCDNIDSIKWLKWLGFTLHEAIPFGVGRALFHHFTMEGDLCAQ